jgi:hypothetical protein
MKILLSRSGPSGPHFLNVLCLARRGNVGFDLYQVEQNFPALSRRFPPPWPVEEQLPLSGQLQPKAIHI